MDEKGLEWYVKAESKLQAKNSLLKFERAFVKSGVDP